MAQSRSRSGLLSRPGIGVKKRQNPVIKAQGSDLEIVAFDAAKDFPQCTRLNHVVQKLCGQPLAKRHHLHWSFLGLGECGIEEGQAKTVLEVPDCINEGGIALLDDGVEVVSGLVLPQPLHSVPVLLLLSLLQLSQEDFEVSELVHNWFVQ